MSVKVPPRSIQKSHLRMSVTSDLQSVTSYQSSAISDEPLTEPGGRIPVIGR
jgi:hypothetical protein